MTLSNPFAMTLVKFSAGIPYYFKIRYEEYLVFDRDIEITLKGGYDCDYNEPSVGFSTVRSMLIKNGTVFVDSILISVSN